MTEPAHTARSGAAAALRGGGLLLAHGVLLALAMPPVGWWPLAFVSLVPAAFVAEVMRGQKARWIFACGLGLLPFWLFTHLWTIPVTVAGYVPLCIFVTSISCCALWLDTRVRARFPALPRSLCFGGAWAAADFFRGELAFDGYPWAFAPHPLIEWWPAASPASLLGLYFVTFLLGALAGACVDLRVRRARAGAIAFVCAAIVWGVSAWLVGARPAPSRSVRVAMIQTNVPQSNKLSWNLEQQLDGWREMRSIAREAEDAKVSFAVWPETMVPGMTIAPAPNDTLREHDVGYVTKDGRTIPAWFFAEDLLRVQQEAGVPMLVGDEAVQGLRVIEHADGLEFETDARFNSVFVVDDGRVGERYDKIHLTPFGEVMPYINKWPWLQQQLLDIGASGMRFDLNSGTARRVLAVRDALGGGDIRVVTPVCFESTDNGLVRSLVYQSGERRADMIAFVTNDGWFGDYDSVRLQHLQAARWRCLELATPGVRAANTGLSAVIDAHGRVLASGTDAEPGKARVAGLLASDVQLGVGRTGFAIVGNIWGWLCLAFCGVGAIASRRRSHKQ